jgi:hypothetical protein
MRGAVLLDLRARQWPQAWPSGRSAQERGVGRCGKTRKIRALLGQRAPGQP